MFIRVIASLIIAIICAKLSAQDSSNVLPQMHLELEQAEILESREQIQGLMQMRTVQDFGIYAGRKTEIIIPSENSGNNSTNQAREQFAKIGGLNIWEDPSGLQINIGGRGLDPNRSSNFNTRQGSYNISADP